MNIKHLVEGRSLVIFTGEGEFVGSSHLSPSIPVLKRESSFGSGDLRPLSADNIILFVDKTGVIRSYVYNEQIGKHISDDIAYFGNHLFEGREIVDWAYSEGKDKIVWCVMSDGDLLGLTINVKSGLLAWHEHTTEGQFRSVSTADDKVYFTVDRDGVGTTLEELPLTKSNDINLHRHLDMNMHYESSEEKFEFTSEEFPEINLLNGKKIGVYADGMYDEGAAMLDSKLRLSRAAKRVVVGLPYRFELKTLNVDNAEGASLDYSLKNIKSAQVRVESSRGVMVGGRELSPPIEDLIGPSKVYSGTFEQFLASTFSRETGIDIVVDKPLDCTILSITPKIEIGE